MAYGMHFLETATSNEVNMLRLSRYLFPVLLIAACGNNRFRETDLVSDQEGVARFTDPALVNPWGITFGDRGELWVANNGTGTITVYDTAGNPITPTGNAIEANEPLTGIAFDPFQQLAVEGGGDTAAADFLFASETGNVVGFTDRIRTLTTIAFTNAGSSFKGIALGVRNDREFVLAADFVNREVVELDQNFVPIGALSAPGVPPEYGPFNVMRIRNLIYVAYAVVGEGGEEEVGAGLGIINEFELDGSFRRRIATGGELNAPWGMAIAPDGYGEFGGDMLVGNFGDGRITAIDLRTRDVDGQLEGRDGRPITIEGLWGLAVKSDAVFFAAGIAEETHGLLGRIEED
jgi:uncharacterized protein (TIGR03118 family)